MPSTDRPYVERKQLPDDHPVIRLLLSVLEDARNGGITSIAMVTVNGSGLSIQTPAQFVQLREIIAGTRALLAKLQAQDIPGVYGVLDGFALDRNGRDLMR